MKKALFSLLLVLLPALPGCLALAAEAPVELFISGAASLTDVLTEIGDAYRKANPHVTLVYSFGSSGTLQSQIEEGAPADIFISAAQKQMDILAEQSLILADTRVDLLENTVVLVVPRYSMLTLTSFADVAEDWVEMVAIGGESVPVGQYTRQLYESLGLWDAVSAKANYGENVRAVLAWVESGDVDCGIVYATDAASTDGVRVIAEAPESTVDAVIYPAAVVASSAQVEAAKDFLTYLTGEEAVVLFEAAGFVMGPSALPSQPVEQ